MKCSYLVTCTIKCFMNDVTRDWTKFNIISAIFNDSRFQHTCSFCPHNKTDRLNNSIVRSFSCHPFFVHCMQDDFRSDATQHFLKILVIMVLMEMLQWVCASFLKARTHSQNVATAKACMLFMGLIYACYACVVDYC